MKKYMLILVLSISISGLYALSTATLSSVENDKLNNPFNAEFSAEPDDLQAGDVIMIRCYIRLSKKGKSSIKIYQKGASPKLIELEPVTEDDDNNSLVVLYELLAKYLQEGYEIESATDAGVFEQGYSSGQKFLSTYILKK